MDCIHPMAVNEPPTYLPFGVFCLMASHGTFYKPWRVDVGLNQVDLSDL